MERFLFNRDEFDQIYNCSMLSPEEWYAYGEKNVPIGIFFIASGVFYMTFYIPILITMLQPEFFSITSYKLMFCVGVIDCFTLVEICFMDGYDTLTGGVPCTNINRFYLFALISTCGWYTGTFIAITLALDRCLEVIAPRKAEILFKGKRTWIWVAFCVLYGQYAFWFQFPFLFNSHYMATFTDPHFGEKYSTPAADPAYYAHNLGVSAAISILYLTICLGWAYKYKNHQIGAVSHAQRLVNIQSFMISAEILGAAVLCCYQMLFWVPDFCFVVGHILWQMSHGDDGFFIFCINKSMRKSVIKIFKKVFCLRIKLNITIEKTTTTVVSPIHPALAARANSNQRRLQEIPKAEVWASTTHWKALREYSRLTTKN